MLAVNIDIRFGRFPTEDFSETIRTYDVFLGIIAEGNRICKTGEAR